MQLKKSYLTAFGNIENNEIEWQPSCNVLLGKNGQGKTSLIEAIYFLGGGRSFRTVRNAELVNFSSQQAIIKGSVLSCSGLNSELGCKIPNFGKTKFYLHDKETRLADGYLGKLIIVAFVPGDTEIIRGPAAERRRFLDKHLADIYPAHLSTLVRYQKALKSKLAILKDGVTEPGMLEPWNMILAETATEITAARIKFVTELDRHLKNILPIVAPNDGQISLQLIKTGMSETDSAPVQESYFKAMMAIWPKEAETQRVLIGPHKDDFIVSLGGVKAREFSSQGQARTLTLLLKLGVIELIEAKTNEKPVVLLDDVDSELDEERARFLFGIFSEQNRQVFITSTTKSNLWPENVALYQVKNGIIDRAKTSF